MFKYFFFLALVMVFQAHSLVEFPKNCLNKEEIICHFGTVKKLSKYNARDMTLFLDKDSLLKKENQIIQWVYGTVLIRVDNETKISFEKNEIRLQKGQYLLFGMEGELNVDVIDGRLIAQNMNVTEGFNIKLRVQLENGKKHLVSSPLQAIDSTEHLERYEKVSQLSKKEIDDYKLNFVSRHKNYLLWAAELNEKLIKRSIAEENEYQKQQVFKANQARLTEKKRKQAYFQKAFER